MSASISWLSAGAPEFMRRKRLVAVVTGGVAVHGSDTLKSDILIAVYAESGVKSLLVDL